MKIQKLKISNWRSIKEVEIHFQDLTMFIGQNNHGKSNILSALLFFFNKYDSVSPLDFNNSSIANELYVEVTFEKLDEYDQKQFAKYVTAHNTMTVRRIAYKNTSARATYHGYLEVPKDDWLNENQMDHFCKREFHKDLPISEYLPKQGKMSKGKYSDAIKEYIESHKESLEFSYQLEPTSFMGLTNVAQGIFGDVYYIPAVKNIAEEFTLNDSSIFGKLLSNLIDKFFQNDKFREAKLKLQELVQILNKKTPDGKDNDERPIEITTIEKKLEDELQAWGTCIDIQINPPEIDKIFKLNTTVWIDDGTRTEVSRKGQGLQRSVIFALMKSYAKITKQLKEERDIPKIPIRQKSDSVFFLYEEPELYLHPQAEKELYRSLKDLAALECNQVILTTHSSSFIDMENYKSIAMVKKEDADTGTKILQFRDELFENEYDKKKFNLVYWINPDRSELFFAKKVILLEGQTDKTIIPYVAEHINAPVFRYDYSLIDCAGKGSIPLYISLLNAFQIPYVAVYDKDFQTYKNEGERRTALRDTEAIESKIDKTLGTSIVFDNDIEEELGITDKNEKSRLKKNPFLILEMIEKMDIILLDSFKEKVKQIYE